MKTEPEKQQIERDAEVILTQLKAAALLSAGQDLDRCAGYLKGKDELLVVARFRAKKALAHLKKTGQAGFCSPTHIWYYTGHFAP